ncbi:MAG: hypothetical protein ABJL67_22190 [Sulfitobacter sp.]
MTKTTIEITYLFNTGRRAVLGKGTIDNRGIIDIDVSSSGQESYIAREMEELNARDYVSLKEPPTKDQPRLAMNKRKVYRDEEGFLEALRDFGLRVYAMEFEFDAADLAVSANTQNELDVKTATAD